MKTNPSRNYESVLEHLVERGLSRADAVKVLDRYAAANKLVDSARALGQFGVAYPEAFGALTAVRGEVAPNPDDTDPSVGLSPRTLAFVGVILAGVGYSLSKSSYAEAVENGHQTFLIFRGLFAAAGSCLFWAAFKWLRW